MSKLIWQLFKYGVIGALATVINFIVAEFCAVYLWPCLGPDDRLVQLLGLPSVEIADATRATLATGCNFVGFMVANLACWVLNRRFVFTPGRHRWFVEYLLFLGGSGFAIACGSAIIWLLVRFYSMQTSYSFMVNVVVSVAINFVVRKFIVFKG